MRRSAAFRPLHVTNFSSVWISPKALVVRTVKRAEARAPFRAAVGPSDARRSNPKGIAAISPAGAGWRRRSYPGGERKMVFNPEGVESSGVDGAARVGCNPFRVVKMVGRQPRVARASQPWAE